MSRQPLDVVYRDKIEVSLDGRQIFYLFFGGAVIVGLVFVLGVMVGRRVEARGHVDRARTTAAQDPLAALDRLESNGGLSFRGALMGARPDHTGNSDVERQIQEIEQARKPEAHAPVVPPAPMAPAPKAEEKKPEPPKPAVEQKPITKLEQVSAPAAKGEEKRAEEKKAEAKVEEKKPEDKKAEDKKGEDKKAEDKKVEDKKVEDKKVEKPDEEKKSKYVLQLSSFQDRAEAEAFLAQIKSAGYSPFITEGNVNGTKFYRVRLGSYKSMDAANDAKSEIEKTLKKSATVMKI